MNTLEKIIKKTASITVFTSALLTAQHSYAEPTVEQLQEEIKTIQSPLASVLNYKSMINHVTEHNSEQATLLAAIIYAESRGNPAAVSPSKCRGLTQLSKTTSKGVAVHDYYLFMDNCDLEEDVCYVLYQDKKGNIIRDNRDKPYPAIYGGYKLLKEISTAVDKNFSKTNADDRRKMKLLVYNAGFDTLCKAKAKTGKDSPTWNDIQKALTSEVIQESLGHFSYFSKHPERYAQKIVEITTFIHNVEKYHRQFKPYFEEKEPLILSQEFL